MVAFKKLLPFLIIVVVIAVAGFGLYWQKIWQKTHIPLDISSAAVEAKCLEDVGKMNEAQIIQKINTLPFATGEELGKLNQLMYKHLRCQFFKNPFEEQFEKTMSLIGSLNWPAEKNSLIFEDLSKYLKSVQENREGVERRISDPSFPLIVYPKERICPDGKEDAGLVEKLLENAANSGYVGVYMEKAQNIISNYCAQIIKYSEDEFSLTKEVYDFKDWPEDSWERKFDYRWKLILAFRFGGEEKSLGVCDNLIDTKEKKDCQDKVDSFNGWPTRQIRAQGCTGYELKETRDLICQMRGQ